MIRAHGHGAVAGGGGHVRHRAALAVLLLALIPATGNAVAATGGSGDAGPTGGPAAAAPRPSAYELQVAFSPAEHRLTGRARMRFPRAATRPDSLVFFLHGELTVDSLACGGAALACTQTPVVYPYSYSLLARRVVVALEGRDPADGLTVWYGGTFHRSGARAPSDYMRIGPDGVFLRSYGYSLWLPVFVPSGEAPGRLAQVALEVSVPEALRTVAVGTCVERRQVGGRSVSRWLAEDVDLFDLQITARRYRIITQDPVQLYVLEDPTGQAAAARIATFVASLDSIYHAWYGEAGDRSQIHVMQMPRHGDIASGNAIGLSGDLWRAFSRRSHTGRTLAHELVHAYVTPQVTPGDSLYALGREGFPSYYHLPALGALLGRDAHAREMARLEEGYRQRRARGTDGRGQPLPPEKPILALTAADVSTYKDRFILPDRVPLCLEDLRRRMGHERFLAWSRALFAAESLDPGTLRAITRDLAPAQATRLHRWLMTTTIPGG